MAKHKNRGGRGLLGGVAYGPEQLYREADRCAASYRSDRSEQPRNFFDKKARRFFNSRVLWTYPVQAKNMTYFVEAFGGGNTPAPRMWRVGVFKNCKVQILGKAKGSSGSGKKYISSVAAKRTAQRMAYAETRKNPRRRKARR